MSDKSQKIMKAIIIVLAIIFITELIYFGIKVYNSRKNSIFYTMLSSIVLKDENNYIGAGFSDYRHSKFNKYDNGYDKATMFEIKDGKTTKEVGLKIGFNSRFNDVTKVDDGYVAVGKIEMTKEQKDETMSEGLIVKFDNNFKIVWRKNVSILEKTELHRVKLDHDELVIVGTSVYSEGYIGNHSTGGGILLKYSLDGKQKLKINNGGPYNGTFNDFIIESDSYVVVGLGRANSGIIIKYDKNGKKLASGSFGYTDKNGIKCPSDGLIAKSINELTLLNNLIPKTSPNISNTNRLNQQEVE